MPKTPKAKAVISEPIISTPDNGLDYNFEDYQQHPAYFPYEIQEEEEEQEEEEFRPPFLARKQQEEQGGRVMVVVTPEKISKDTMVGTTMLIIQNSFNYVLLYYRFTSTMA